MDWKHKEFYKEKELFTFKNVDNTRYLTRISSYDILYPQRYERYWILILLKTEESTGHVYLSMLNDCIYTVNNLFIGFRFGYDTNLMYTKV